MKGLAVSCTNLSFSYSRESILEDASCAIEPHEFVCLFGPNGGGKTTLLKLLMGFLLPQKGSVSIFGKPPEEMRHRIGYVPQAHRTDLEFPITVKELIAMGRPLRRSLFSRIRPDDWEAAHFWMERLRLLDHQDKAYGELSGGLAQRALLARALVSEPALLLLDEPTANVDAPSTALILDTLDELKQSLTILLVTHDLKTAAAHATKLLCIQGSIQPLAPSELCEHFAFGLYTEMHSKVGFGPRQSLQDRRSQRGQY